MSFVPIRDGNLLMTPWFSEPAWSSTSHQAHRTFQCEIIPTCAPAEGQLTLKHQINTWLRCNNHLEKYESQWEGLSHIYIYIMENKKWLKPPTSKSTHFAILVGWFKASWPLAFYDSGPKKRWENPHGQPAWPALETPRGSPTDPHPAVWGLGPPGVLGLISRSQTPLEMLENHKIQKKSIRISPNPAWVSWLCWNGCWSQLFLVVRFSVILIAAQVGEATPHLLNFRHGFFWLTQGALRHKKNADQSWGQRRQRALGPQKMRNMLKKTHHFLKQHESTWQSSSLVSMIHTLLNVFSM